jgi:hypothetical protein
MILRQRVTRERVNQLQGREPLSVLPLSVNITGGA